MSQYLFIRLLKLCSVRTIKLKLR